MEVPTTTLEGGAYLPGMVEAVTTAATGTAVTAVIGAVHRAIGAPGRAIGATRPVTGAVAGVIGAGRAVTIGVAAAGIAGPALPWSA